ncbi:hypothetical protein [Sorangium sp. So ce117]|uniref:hypothetical protein n=1 Tax=Sorangium sp. So ce117 TaxID=3133277 RepID=UPI003F5F07D4
MDAAPPLPPTLGIPPSHGFTTAGPPLRQDDTPPRSPHGRDDDAAGLLVRRHAADADVDGRLDGGEECSQLGYERACPAAGLHGHRAVADLEPTAGLGAVHSTDAPRLVVRVGDPQDRAAASAEFLVEEDYEEPFTTTDDAVLDRALFTITFERDGDRVHLTFEDSGGQDWAFVAMLPQLSGDDPTLRPSS